MRLKTPGLLPLLAALCVATASAQDSGRTALAEAATLRQQADQAARAGASGEQLRLLARLADLERSPRAFNDHGLALSDAGEFERAAQLLEQAAAAAPADQRGLYRANLALNLRRQWRDAEAETLLRDTLQQIDAYNGPLTGWRRANLARSRAVALLQLSRIAERRGRLDDALALARDAQAAAQQALPLVPWGASAGERALVAADLANTLRRELYVRIQAQAWPEGEAVLQRWLATAREHALGPLVDAQAQAAAAALAMSRRRFDVAERHAAAADGLYARHQLAPPHLARVTVLETRVAALWAQGRAADALPLLDTLDDAVRAGGQADTARVAQMPLARGLVLLDSGRAADAVPLFEALVQHSLASAGAGSLPHAQAQGLLGLALRAAGRDRERAASLLQQAVQLMASPLHAGVPDGSGLRPLIRRRLVDAWVDAQVDAAGTPPPQALALLDWTGDSAVQRAVSLAAVRMAIQDAALRDAVRREQDLRAEIEALTTGAGDDGRAQLPAAGSGPSPAAQRMQVLTRELDEVVARIRQGFPGYAALTQPVLATPERLHAALAPGEALLVLLQRPHDLLGWLLRADGRVQGLCATLPQAEATALVARVRQTLEFPERGKLPAFDRRAAGRLQQLLLQPFEGALADVQHLSVVAGGPLSALPLAVLAPADGRPDRDAAWPVKRLAISHAPSVSAWLAARAAPAPADTPLTLLGWGDPVFGRAIGSDARTRGDTRLLTSFVLPPSVQASLPTTSMPSAPPPLPPPEEAFPALPETRDELLAMARALGADPERSLYLGERATRDSVLEASRSGALARARIVALATHGLKAGEWPGLDQPALVMAIPPGRSGSDATQHMLRLSDTLGLKLHADWVVLSACNTTAADHEAGEALSGLARGMFYAGARSLLATHWAVETRSATLLVTGTFKAYASPARPGKAESLRQAMLQVMQQPGMAHPAYWAPYVLIGDGGR